ncbi:MAG: 3-deoxy-manno-octulosonate cytidylyltransferase [Bacteroidales bacterium]|jgi:3-deoxy-manno-octulosonate cytidylyltransferase (CMP-KDO synthetase)|nr:3-deoxy-manno-octulosonate cytidylyltransferase [Bacteroidales bacterium]HOL98721.1 3-deoxy-manno-octulosonate cytidylyltransferase [Bacteroidales bacterium]HOM36971.1 3-deoxy-manno-octulosonate cytidylyltransferase [Bacteroidales bacterium]HPD24606.1 3-deoxy-manno-octulosonate cytidylyltransferase [Bacteroidales bacterium]HRT00370.1 3-deoxy-manno-octulosonate cytidylyltransferase [Bacteroidales bacterium]
MNFIAIIPARYASTRFPGKPLIQINGKSMIQNVYIQAKKVFEHVYVATDDERIAQEVERFGGKFVMTKKKHKSGTDRCAEAITKIEVLENMNFDVIVNVQGDEPFIKIEQLLEIKKCFSRKRTQIATLAKPINNIEDIFNPNKPKLVVNSKKEALYFSRSPIPYVRGVVREKWIAKHLFYKHIGLYAYRKDVLLKITKLCQTPLEIAESLEQLRWLENGFTINVAFTEHESISIDTPKDLEKVKQLGLL